MADWEKGLTPLKSWEDGLKPQGTATKTEDYIAGPQNNTLRDFLGTGSNVASMAASGAGLGALFGGLPAVAGGAIGAGVGALLPPSESPATDLGATAADLLASRFVPGGLNTGRRLARVAATVAAPGLGAFLGSQGDKALGFQKETPWGKISIYSALATPGAILGSLASEASPVAQAAERLKNATGVDIPLSTAETTGRFGATEKMLTTGSNASEVLGQAQDAAAQSALEKILGAPMEKSLDVVLRGTEVAKDARGVMNDWRRAWQTANPKVTTQQVPSSVLGPNGQPIMQTVTTTSKNPVVDWNDFSKVFGLTGDERNAFFRAIRKDPESFVNQFLPGREDQVKGLVKLRAVMTVLDKGGHQPEAGQLGQAVVMRYLRGPVELGQAADGTSLAQRINGALGSTTEPGHLAVALGPQRADALRDLATVLNDASPLEKIANEGVSAQKRAGQYLFNKAVFTTASVGTVAAIGTAHSVPLGTLLLGMSGGAVVGIGAPALVGAMMMNPKLGKVLIAASKGDSAATGRILRTLGSAKMASDDREETNTAQTPASRLQGLFSK